MSKQVKAELALVLVTLFWGFSYYLVDISLAELPEMTLNAMRFVLAFVVLAIIFHKRVFTASPQTLKYSLYVGLLLVLVYTGSTFGIARTSLSNAGFICALPMRASTASNISSTPLNYEIPFYLLTFSSFPRRLQDRYS